MIKDGGKANKQTKKKEKAFTAHGVVQLTLPKLPRKASDPIFFSLNHFSR